MTNDYLVIYRNMGTDFPPVVTRFPTLAAIEYILGEVATVKPHWAETRNVIDAGRVLPEFGSFTMTAENGAECIWSIHHRRRSL